MSFPVDEPVSIFSVSDSKSTPRDRSSVVRWMRSPRLRPSRSSRQAQSIGYFRQVKESTEWSHSASWNLITRTIMPIINQPSPAPGIQSAFGLGDINPTVFLSPANSSKLLWGVGPTMTLPTESNALLGNGKVECGTGHCVTCHARALGLWSAGEQPVVVRRLGQKERERAACRAIR